jgi:hypothetical protein
MNNRSFAELQTGDKFYRVNDVHNGRVVLYTKLQNMRISFNMPSVDKWMVPVEVNSFITNVPGCFEKIPVGEEVVKVD